MSQLRNFAFMLVLATLVGGCSALNEVNDVTSAGPGDPIAGIPFRLADRYRVRVFQLQPDGSYTNVYEQSQDMPNQERILAANFSGAALSDHEFKVELNADNTLKTTHLKTVQKITDAANAVADQAAAINTARQQQQTGSTTARTARQTLDETYVDLKGKAEVAEAQYDAAVAKSASTAVEITTAKTAMALAKKKANDAAVNVGLPLPYPDQ